MEGVEGPALFGFQVICCHDSVLLVLLGLSSTFPPVLTALIAPHSPGSTKRGLEVEAESTTQKQAAAASWWSWWSW